jgi:undecaprenyl-diphosphatase
MRISDAVILGIVEGLTEFLPVSSTGHLILAGDLLKIPESVETKAFDVISQSGAMLAVIWHYQSELLHLVRGFFSGDKRAQAKVWAIVVAFIPAAVIGLAFNKVIKAHLFGVGPVVAAMVAGGVIMIVVERVLRARARNHGPEADAEKLALAGEKHIGLGQAGAVGFFQCLAMWPGTSRSMVTILGGRLVGLSAVEAAHFSFLLAIPTLLGATAVDLLKNRENFMGADTASYLTLGIGTAVSFVVALIVIRGFLGFLRKHSLEVFGWYRIVAGLALWVYYR